MRLLIAVMIVVLGLTSSADALNVQYSNERLSITCENTPFAQVAKALSDRLGIIVYLDKSQQSTKLTLNIQNMPLERALRMLTFPLNYALVTDYLGKPQELRIFKNPSIKDSEYARYSSVTHIAQSTQPAEYPQLLGSQTTTQVQVFDTPPTYPTATFTPTSGVKGTDGLAIASWVTARMLQKDQLMQNAHSDFKYQQALKASAQPAVIASAINAISSNTFASPVASQPADTNLAQTHQAPEAQPSVTVDPAKVEAMKSDPRLQQYAQMMLATSRGQTALTTSSAYTTYMQMLTQRMAQQTMIANQTAQSASNTPMRYLFGQTSKAK